jgi:hypothetical protein
LTSNTLRRWLDWLALQWRLSTCISNWLSRTSLSNLCRRCVRGYTIKHPLHVWAKYSDHHLLKHVQESSMVFSHYIVHSFPKSLQDLLFLLSRCGIRLPWQKDPWHVRFEVQDTAPVLAKRHQTFLLELVDGILQM